MKESRIEINKDSEYDIEIKSKFRIQTDNGLILANKSLGREVK